MSFNQSNQFTIQKIVGQTTASPNLNILDVQFARPDAWSPTIEYLDLGFPVFNVFDGKTYEVVETINNLNKRPDLNTPVFWLDSSGTDKFKTFVPGTPIMFNLSGNPNLIIVKIQEFSSSPMRKLAAGVVIHDTKRQNKGILSSNSETRFRIASRGSVVYLKNATGPTIPPGTQVGYADQANLVTDPRISAFVSGTHSPVGIALEQFSTDEIARVLIQIPIIPEN